MEFLTRRRWVMAFFRTGVSVMVLLGAILQLKLVWNMADLFMTVMALMNIYAILRRPVSSDAKEDGRPAGAEGEKENPVNNLYHD